MTNKAVWVTSFVVGLASGGELYRWVMNEDPNDPYRLLVFFVLLLVVVASAGTAVAHYLAVRFNKKGEWLRSTRHGVEVGLFVAVCAWLQLVHLLSLIVAVLVAGALVSVELVLANWPLPQRPRPQESATEQG